MEDSEFRPLWDGYTINRRGMVKVTRTTAGGITTERMLMPDSVHGSIIYNMRTAKNPARQYSVNTLVEEVFGIKSCLIPQGDLHWMRRDAKAFNDVHCPTMAKDKGKEMSRGIQAANQDRMAGFSIPDPWTPYKDKHGNVWPAMKSQIPGVSWNDPIMDPMSRGFPLVTFSVPSTAAEVAA